MKIVISSDDTSIESNVDQRFGRCKYFVIVDIENNKITNVESVANEGYSEGHGAGIKAAQQVGNLKPDKILTGNIGPNALNVLEQLNIEVYQGSGRIQDAIHKLQEGKLEKLSQNVNEIPRQQQEEQGGEDDIMKENKKIFMPLLNDNGEDSEISEHFGHAPFFGLYDTKERRLTIIQNTLDHSDPNKSPVDQITEAFNPAIVFTKGIGSRAIELFNEKEICLKTGDYKTAKEVINNLNNLEDIAGSCGH